MNNQLESFQQSLFGIPAKVFQKHLDKEDNNRIIFSGRFGMGKSYFLNKFFGSTDKDVWPRRFKVFHLYPVNYSIANNEDIYNYIKYDIINSMLSQGIQLGETIVNEIDALPEYVNKNPFSFLAQMISMIPKIGKEFSNINDQFQKLRENINKKYPGLNKDEKLLDFINNIAARDGSIFENGIVTGIIADMLSKIKEDEKVETVLILDDLDRVDPAHAFGLLNIFSAHMDNQHGLPNKLGFDRIILVCDINNLRHIFKTNYGAQSDFNGYIDKFYSHEIFHFDNRKALNDISYKTFQNVSLGELDFYDLQKHQHDLFVKPSLAIELLQIFIKYGMVNLRTLLIRSSYPMEIDIGEYVKFGDLPTVSKIYPPFLGQIFILKEIVGSYELIKEYINRLPVSSLNFSNLNLYCNQLAYFVNYEKTFIASSSQLIVINGNNFFIRPPEYIRDGIDNIVVYKNQSVGEANPAQHMYHRKEFIELINDFLDIIERIDV